MILRMEEKFSRISPDMRQESASFMAHSPGNCHRQILNTISGLMDFTA